MGVAVPVIVTVTGAPELTVAACLTVNNYCSKTFNRDLHILLGKNPERERERENNDFMHTAEGETYSDACYCSKTFDRDLHILLWKNPQRERESERERERNKILCIPLMERHTMIHVPCSPLHV